MEALTNAQHAPSGSSLSVEVPDLVMFGMDEKGQHESLGSLGT